MTTPRRYGWIKDQPDHRDFKFIFTPRHEPLPDLIDLRPQCPSVYNQGELGSCVANSVSGDYEFLMLKQGIPHRFHPSRLFVYYNARVSEGINPQEDSGTTIRAGIKAAVAKGMVDEAIWPYDIAKFSETPSPEAYLKASRHIVVKYERARQHLDELRHSLASGLPIAFGFQVYESFETDDVARTGLMPMPQAGEESMGGHAVLAVGYDHPKQVFIVRNSWGEEWGDGGYFYMPYDFILDPDQADDFWVLDQVADRE